MPTLTEVAAALYEHCPDFLSGTCRCGADVPVYQMWIDHVVQAVTEDSAVARAMSAIDDARTKLKKANDDEI